MNKLFAVLAFTAFTTLFQPVVAQSDKNYDDLMLLYLDEKYDKLLAKAEKYASDSDLRKDPAPYLYASKACFEMSKREEYAKDMPTEKALRSAMRWAAKYRKKDPDGNLYRENEVYFEQLKEVVVEEAENNMMEEKYSKAKRYYDSITDFDPEDPGAWMMLGFCNLKMRSTESTAQLQKAGELASSKDMSRALPVEKRLLSFALMSYSQHLKNEGQKDSARVVINYGDPALMDDREFKMVHGELN